MATFTNQATLSYNGNTVNSNIVTGNVIEVLSATKTAVNSDYTAGEDISYVVSIVNTGAAPVTGVSITDDLGAYAFTTGTLRPLDYVANSALYYQNGILQATPTVTDADNLVISGITVPAGGNVLVVYDARANGLAPLEATGSITNTVSVTAPGITAPITDTATVNASTEPVLTINKALSPTDVVENGELTYTFTIQNTGNTEADAADNVIISDTFNPILENITVTLNGATLPDSSYTYSEDTGVFTTNAGAITVPAATFAQDTATGAFITTPGTAILTVTGTV